MSNCIVDNTMRRDGKYLFGLGLMRLDVDGDLLLTQGGGKKISAQIKKWPAWQPCSLTRELALSSV